MLKINKKLQLPLLLFAISISGIFLYQYLTFIPDYSSAKSISTDIPITPTTPVTEWDKLEYMQQMTLEACNSVPTPAAKNSDGSINTNVPTKSLKDSRDGKTYWIAKLADGQCWMTQNLDLDLSTDKPLTSDDSDIDSSIGSWAPEDSSENTITTALNSTVWPNTNNIIRSWDPALGKAATYCNDGTTATAGKCKTSGNPTTSVNDGHDAQGNYYSWAAATAGTLGTSGSICPKGWQLPTSGNTDPKSFGGLTAAYGIGNNSAGSTALRTTPLYFVYSGYIPSDSLSNAGSDGRYWSSTVNISSDAYGLYFYSTYVNPSGTFNRYRGFPVRCVASSAPSQPTSGIDSPDITVKVPNIITLDVSDSVSIETKANAISEGSFTASVSSNTPYSIVLSTTNGGHTDLRNENGSGAIPTLTSSQALTSGTSAWGIKCINPTNSTNCTQTSYTGLTNYLNPTLFFKSTAGGLNLSTTFQIGIAISPDLPSGTYTTDILVTAATAD